MSRCAKVRKTEIHNHILQPVKTQIDIRVAGEKQALPSVQNKVTGEGKVTLLRNVSVQ